VRGPLLAASHNIEKTLFPAAKGLFRMTTVFAWPLEGGFMEKSVDLVWRCFGSDNVVLTSLDAHDEPKKMEENAGEGRRCAPPSPRTEILKGGG